jgi:putative tricarboxylic transport membrane protein
MDFLTNLAQGFQIGLLPINLLYCFIGVLLGTLIGVLPGIGPSATIALLLPTTFRISPVSAIIMLAGIYYGAQYGGSTTSILVNIPGEAASVVTCLDGYKMARKGRAGPALGISAFGSFIAGTLSVLGLMILAIPLSHIALKFGFPEYFAIMCLGLSIVSYLGRGSFFKSLLMAAVGVSISFIGMDVVVGKPRFDFGLLVLGDGVGLIPLLMGLFGIAEVFSNLEQKTQARDVFQTRIEGLLPNRQDWKDSWGAILRGSVLGFSWASFPEEEPWWRPFSPMPWRGKFPGIRKNWEPALSRGWPGPSRPITRLPGELSSPSSSWGFPPMWPWPCSWGP